MKGYYKEKLASENLLKVYEIAPLRVQQYLSAELNYVSKKIHSKHLVLDLGCGYGRIIPQLARKAKFVIGIDTSYASLLMGKALFISVSNCLLIEMNAIKLGFLDNSFDIVICIQNGISRVFDGYIEIIVW